MNFLCMLMEDCNGILHGEDSSLDIGDTSGLGYKKQIASPWQEVQKGGGDYLPGAFPHLLPWHSLRITKHILPSPTSSPWSKGWSPAWDASGIRPHWTTNSCLQRWHWSGTCRREKRARRTLMLGNQTQNESLPPLFSSHQEGRSTVQTMENLRGRELEKQDNYSRNGDNQARQGNCTHFVTEIGKWCTGLTLNGILKAHLRVTHTCMPTVPGFPLPQRAEGSIAISCVNTLHSLHFAQSPKEILHAFGEQWWPTGEAKETASPQPKYRGND